MNAGFFTLTIIIVTVLVSYKGFTNNRFFEDYEFEVDRILIDRQYYRLLTSGFLHTGWTHLVFNMFSLYFFSGAVTLGLGSFNFLLIYFVSMIGGCLLSLLLHRNHGQYSAVGASGAVCGVMFASVALFPDLEIRMFPLPFSIPGWVYAVLYIGFSIYGVRSQKDNIGHDAHLGGGLVGMLVVLILNPAAFVEHIGVILMIVVPVGIFIYLIITRPHILFVDNLFFKNHNDFYSIDHRDNVRRASQQREVDRILDKISRSGMGSLSPGERKILRDYSDKGS
jgi:membrane associated rhomboid family serine protease